MDNQGGGIRVDRSRIVDRLGRTTWSGKLAPLQMPVEQVLEIEFPSIRLRWRPGDRYRGWHGLRRNFRTLPLGSSFLSLGRALFALLIRLRVSNVLELLRASGINFRGKHAIPLVDRNGH